MCYFGFVMKQGITKFENRLFKHLIRIAVFVLTTIFMLTSVSVAADPPPVEDCSAGENEPYMACEEKQLTAQTELLTELDELIGIIE